MHVSIRIEEGQHLHILTSHPPPPTTPPLNKTMSMEKYWTHLTQSLLQQILFCMLCDENKIVLCFNHSLMCIIGTLKGVFLSSRICDKRRFFSLAITSMDHHVLVGTEDGATTAHFSPPPPPLNRRCKWKNILTQSLYATNFIFHVYKENKIVFCFHHSLTRIVWRWNRSFCLPESMKSGDFEARVRGAWIHVLVGTEEEATTAHFNHDPHPSRNHVNRKIFDTVNSRFCNKGYFLYWLWRAWMYILFRTEQGAITAHFNPCPSLLNVWCKWKIFDTV